MRTAIVLPAGMLMLVSPVTWAVDSYRFLHVTSGTPWSIFIFLLPMVLSPLLLMAVLYWYFAFHKKPVPPVRQEEFSKTPDEV